MRTAGQGPGGFEKRDGFIKPGQDLVVAGYAGMAGARLIFQKKKEKLEGHFAPSFLRCLEEKDSYNVKEWLENELKQTTIATGLRQALNKNGNLGEMIAFVIKNSGYYTQKEADDLERHLVMLNSKTSAERIKAKADILLDNHKYNMAISFYQSIINKGTNSELSETFYGSVYNNLGVAYTRLFEYDEALVAFRNAYRLNSAAESLESIILCDLMSGNATNLKNDVEKYKVSDQVVNRLRTEIIQLKAHIHVNWNDTIEKDYISRRKREYIVEINS